MLFSIPFYSLFGVVVVKAIMFAIFDKSMPKFRGFGLMVLGNVVSSLIGLLLSIGAIVPIYAIVIPIIVYAV